MEDNEESHPEESGPDSEETESDSEDENCIYEYDIITKKVITDCELKPTDVDDWEATPWLYAWNNKYEDDYDSNLVGKWMIFVPFSKVNDLWIRIKEAITDSHLWNSKVSTAKNGNRIYAIMIYTKDYTDIEDVISVLDYLEKSGLKPPGRAIKYKTDNQTRAGIYCGSNQRPSIYSSDTIRETKKPHETAPDFRKERARRNPHAIREYYRERYDLINKKVITRCIFNPTEINRDVKDWLYAENNKYTKFADYDPKLGGKWMIFVPSSKVNEVWIQIKGAIKESYLWQAKVSTKNPDRDTHVIMISTKDYNDIQDVIEVLHYLEESGIKPQEEVIKYKTNDQTCEGGNKRPWIYTSNTIREMWNSLQEARKRQPESASYRTGPSNKIQWSKSAQETGERQSHSTGSKNYRKNSNETNEYLSWRKRP